MLVSSDSSFKVFCSSVACTVPGTRFISLVVSGNTHKSGIRNGRNGMTSLPLATITRGWGLRPGSLLSRLLVALLLSIRMFVYRYICTAAVDYACAYRIPYGTYLDQVLHRRTSETADAYEMEMFEIGSGES